RLMVPVVTVSDVTDPVADAGEYDEVSFGTTTTLDGSGSTDNAGIENYTWSFTDGSEVALYGAVVEYVFSVEGGYVVTLTATDDAGLSDTDTLVVMVAAVNAAPVANAGFDVASSEGETVELDGSGSIDDASADLLTYTWTFEYDGELVTLTGAQAEFTFDIAGTYEVTLNVTDAEGLWDTDTMTVTVEKKGTTLFNHYWWAFAGAAVIAVVAVPLALMKGGVIGGDK
ncbi:MAG: PKD domain-containing protein, partial [Thermoplasmata archaeon]|nr:PKD domain-containing protein [Thermoplasmata archaeon]